MRKAKNEVSPEEWERLKKLDNIRKERCYKKKLDNAPMIECACGCGKTIKSVDAYGRTKKYIEGHNRRKYEDPKEYKRVWHEKFKKRRLIDPILRQLRKDYKRKHNQERKARLVKEKGGKCTRCPLEYNGKNAAAFQFHHRDPSAKEDQLRFWWSWERIYKEAEKCDLVCASCHFLIHGEEY